jgi:hypothetical protein
MALIKTNRAVSRAPAVFEDPRPIGNRIYFWHEGFEKSTLSYVFDSGLNHSVAGNINQEYAFPALAPNSSWRHTGVLNVTGDDVHCTHRSTTNNISENNLDLSMMISMDPINKSSQHRYILGNSGVSAIYSSFQNFQRNDDLITYQVRVNPTGELDTSFPTKGSTTVSGINASWPVYFNPATENLIHVMNFSGSLGAYLNAMSPGRIRNILAGATAPSWEGPGGIAQISLQFIGVASDGNTLFLSNSQANDNTQIFLKYNDIANTTTTLQTINAAPDAAGTSAGGTRTTGFGNTLMKMSSKTFANNVTAANRDWYTPYLDVNGRYHPLYFQWDRSTDTFTRNSDITINWGAGKTQDDYWLPDTLSAAGNATGHSAQRLWYNESFTVTASGTTTRYLTLFQLHGSGTVFDAQPRMRTFVTFAVNAADRKILTYHSSVIIPETPKNIIWLDDTFTTFGVFAWNNFYIYSFNQLTGWQLTNTLPFRFEAVGRDGLGRIWAVDAGPLQYGRLHLITPAIPATISVILASNSYNYSGVDIDTTALVSAFNISGGRIVTSVTLSVEGESLKLINSSNEEVTNLVVTTSSSAATTVNVRVVGAGTSNIIASINV